jgi:hypothetical protein
MEKASISAVDCVKVVTAGPPLPSNLAHLILPLYSTARIGAGT